MTESQQILSDITVYMKYAKFLPELNRRETWDELVARNAAMHIKKYPELKKEIYEAYKLVRDKKILPSMRSLQFAGKPIDINPSRIFNCGYLPISDWRAFSETMFLLLSGVGVGYSVQFHHVEQLPEIVLPNNNRKRRYLIGDSIEGWSDAIKVLIKSYYFGGPRIDFDYSDIRPKGANLVTSGGKAPGPQPLRECIVKIEGILSNKQSGEKLTPIEAHDILCHIADSVLAGGIRRSALLALFSANDNDMISCKSGTWWELNPQRGRANNSVALIRRKITQEFFMDLWKKVEASGAGEPGFYLSNSKDWGTNPCFSPNTLIAVADGRGAVPIQELAEAGEDVPVYTVDRITGKVRIEMGRSPRLTRTDSELVRVTLDDGSHLDVTPDHGMLLRDGNKVEAKNLMPGDSLSRFTKRAERISTINKSRYWRMYCDTRNSKRDKIYEHRLISKFYNADEWDALYDSEAQNGWLDGGIVVHHKDYNPLNNRPDNLQLMTFKAHAKFHADHDNNGENNGRYSGYTNLQIEEYAKNITKEYGRRLSDGDWININHTYPKRFSKWRALNWFSTPTELLKWAAMEVGVEHGDVDPRVVKTYYTAKANGYDAYIKNNEVMVTKICPTCKNEYDSTWDSRHSVYCSGRCYSKHETTIESFLKHISKGVLSKQKRVQCDQIKIYNNLKISLGRDPFKIEWGNACKQNGVPFRIRTEIKENYINSYIFKSYKELKNTAAEYNHTVVSVEKLNTKSDVYNITVDNTHTVGIITKMDDMTMSGIFTTQCCEIALRPNQYCNLVEVNVSDLMDQADLNARVRAATFIGTLQAGYTNFHYLRPIWQRNTEKDALIGVSMTGVGANKLDGLNLREAAQIVIDENARVAGLIGINVAARTTCLKPAGTTSLVMSTSSGIHAYHSKYYIRRLRVGKNEAIYEYLKNHHPELVEDEYFRPHDTAVISVPQKAPDGAILRTESPFDLLERVKAIYQTWVAEGHRDGANTHNISATISVKDDEWEPVGKWMWENRNYYNGLSVLPYDGGTYKQTPFEEITEERYNELIKYVHNIDLTQVKELDDNTNLSGELACAGGGCEI